jgi:hypothetical protein
VKIRETHPFIVQPVDVWCSENRMTMAGKVAVTLIVRENEDDVWANVFRRESAKADGEDDNNERAQELVEAGIRGCR